MRSELLRVPKELSEYIRCQQRELERSLGYVPTITKTWEVCLRVGKINYKR